MKYNLAKRVVVYIFVLMLLSLGTALASKANLGVSPASSFPFAGSMLTPLSFGMCIAAFQILCVGLQFAHKPRMTVKLAFQLPTAYAFGFLTDFFVKLLVFPPPGIALGALMVAVSASIIGLGVRIHFGVSLILMPVDALVRVISEVVGWSLPKTKFTFDLSLVVITVTLTLIVFGNAFAAVGIGTIISMLLIGPTVGLWQKIFPFFDALAREEQ